MLNFNRTQFDEALKGGKPVLADFWAPWCGHCRRIEGACEQTAGEWEGRLVAVKINIDEEGELARQEGITVIPTLVLYRDGRRLASLTAPRSKLELDEFLKSQLGR